MESSSLLTMSMFQVSLIRRFAHGTPNVNKSLRFVYGNSCLARMEREHRLNGWRSLIPTPFISSRPSSRFMFSIFDGRIQTPPILRLARTGCGQQPDPHRRREGRRG